MASTSQTDPRSVPELIRELAGETSTLLRTEVELVKAEAAKKVEEAKVAVVAAIAGFAIFYSGVLIILFGVVWGLAESMPLWCAGIVVGVIAAIAGLIMLRAGVEKASPEKLAPKQSAASVRDSTQKIQEQLS